MVKWVNLDCTHPEVRHEHGTYVCYVQDGCRCDPCREARRARRRQWELERVGLRPSSFVDASEARAIAERLAEAGISLKHLARATDLSHGSLSRLIYGWRDVGPSRKVARRTLDRLRRAEADFHDEFLVLPDGVPIPADEAKLIVTELVARGWSKRAIASHVAGEPRGALQLFKGSAEGTLAGTLRRLREAMCMEVPMRVHSPTGRLYQPKGRLPREVPRLTPHVGGPEFRKVTAADRVLDLLDAEGGWVSELELLDRLNASESAVSQALRRLVSAGLLESRTGPMSFRLRNPALLLDAG